jgi:pimeloyl-ACP methyl ester carboxylesterase
VPAVFVHGNPETAAVWRPLIAELGRDDVITLSPPGFGAPVPLGFGATYDEYVAWLARELESIGAPVDLVGHDWGSNHVLRLSCERPDLLRSWSGDTAGTFAPDYVWADASLAWMTPGVGEKAIAAQLAMGVAGRVELYETLGMTREIATELAEAFDEPMGQSILNVYRSDLLRVWETLREQLPAASARPGLVIAPTGDTYTGGEARHRWAAERMGAKVAVLEGLGHWWMLQDPALGAETLSGFWASLDQ